MSKIQTFIEKNHLDFEGSGSSLNSTFCILSGYALYLELTLAELYGRLSGAERIPDGVHQYIHH